MRRRQADSRQKPIEKPPKVSRTISERGYSKAELFELWTYFRGQSNAVHIMQDFALCSKTEARALIDEFERLRRRNPNEEQI